MLLIPNILFFVGILLLFGEMPAANGKKPRTTSDATNSKGFSLAKSKTMKTGQALSVFNSQTILKRRTRATYECDSDVYDPNGYTPNGKGIELNVAFFKVNNEWSANVSWNIPTRGNRSKCIGYRIMWFRDVSLFGSPYCDNIRNESITSYIINSSKGWKDDHELGVAVFPLPANSRSSSRMLRWFSIHSTTTEAITSSKEAATTSGQGSTRQTSPTGQQHNRTGSTRQTSPTGQQHNRAGANKTVMILVLISVLGLVTTITFVVV